MLEPSTATGQVVTGTDYNLNARGYLKGISVAAAAAAATVTVYDNATAASGTIIANYAVLAGTSFGMDFGPGITFNNGLTIHVTGVGGTAVGYYQPGQ